MEWSETPQGRLNVKGVQLECACYGPPPDIAPTIVMLHEGLGSVALWRDFPQRVAAATGMGVFAFSRRGHGQSDLSELPRPLDFMTGEALDVLPHVLDGIGFQSGVLLGHSDGATIAAIYAGGVADHRVRGLILMAPHFFTEDMGLAAIEGARASFQTDDLRARMAKYHRDAENTFRGWADTWLHPDFKAWNVTEVIDYFRIPVLAIQGLEDQYGTPAQVLVIDERSYAPVDVVLLEDCGHSPHLEQSEKTLAEIETFAARLARIEAAAGAPA